MLHSSSGPGHQILSLRIEGSNPSCSTKPFNKISISNLHTQVADLLLKIGTETELNDFFAFA